MVIGVRTTQMNGCLPSKGKGMRKLIHRRYDTITIHESYTSKRCCGCGNDLDHYWGDKGKEVYRLLSCDKCVSGEHKRTVFRSRDANAATNIMNIAVAWIQTRTRPEWFQHRE